MADEAPPTLKEAIGEWFLQHYGDPKPIPERKSTKDIAVADPRPAPPDPAIAARAEQAARIAQAGRNPAWQDMLTQMRAAGPQEQMVPRGPAPVPNPVPPGYNPFDPRHAAGGAAAALSTVGEAPLTPLNELLADQGQPLPGQPGGGPAGLPGGPGGRPISPKDRQTNFNTFLDSLIGAANANPTGSLDPFDRNHQALILRQSADKEEDILWDLEKDLANRQKEHHEAEMKALKPLWDAQDKRYAEQAKLLEQDAATFPDYMPPLIKPQDAQFFAYATLAVALVGGLAGKGGWMNTASAFNGMIDGFVEGNKEKIDTYNKIFHEEYEAAAGKYKAQRERMADILNATDVPINRILKEAEMQAKIDGAEWKVLEAQQGHIDKLRRMSVDEEKMATQIDMVKARLETQIDASLAHFGYGRGGSMGGANLDEYGMWAAAKMAMGGNLQVLQMLTSRWASPQRAEIFNIMAKEMQEQGIDPTYINQAMITLHVERAAQRWSKVRWEAVGRLEVALEELRPALEQGVLAANKLHPRAYNAPLNELIKRFTVGPDAAKVANVNTLALTVGREYMTLATMPVSNAQMHWGSADLAQKMVNGAMSIAEVEGFYEAITKEIAANKKGLESATLGSMQDVMSLGKPVRSEDFGLPPRATENKLSPLDRSNDPNNPQTQQQQDWTREFEGVLRH